jgi:hypothetical protein
MRPRFFDTAQLELEEISVALGRAYPPLPKGRKPLSRTKIILGLFKASTSGANPFLCSER